MLLFLSIMLCYCALKIHLLWSRTRILAYNFAWQFTTCSRKFLYRAVLLECINESIYRIRQNIRGGNFRGWTAKWSFAGKHSRLRT